MRTTLWILAPALALIPSLAQAQNVCAERQALVSQLEQAYEEAPIAQALTSDGKMVEVLAAKDGTTWTLLMTRPDGVTCALAEGEFWQTVEHQLAQDRPNT